MNTRTASVALALAGLLAVVPVTAFAITLNGGSGNDVLKGTDNVDTIKGFGGNDDIYGYRGGDSLYGGTGNDRIWGGSGNDKIYAWHGDNFVSGGEGHDTIMATGNILIPNGELEENEIRGYGGDDIITITDAAGRVWGGPGNDRLEGVADSGYGGWFFDGEGGNDYARVVDNQGNLFGGYGSDRLIGLGEASHNIDGGYDNDKIELSTDINSNGYGGPGDDYLKSWGDATLYGNEGNDILESQGSINYMYGGAGADEFRCYSDEWGYDIVMDFNAAQGDKKLGTCETSFP